jgi:hypothetical protein
MNVRLADYSDLLRFLRTVQDELIRTGSLAESERVARALLFSGGSMTEFMGESRIALRAVRNSATQHLDDRWLERIDSVIGQIDSAFLASNG